MTEDKPEPTPEVQRKHIIEALEMVGFENQMGFYVKPHKGNLKIVVNLSDDKKAVYFRDGMTDVLEDDENGTLAKIGSMIIDAEDGIMPAVPGPDDQVVEPKPDEKIEQPRPVPSNQPKQEVSGTAKQDELPIDSSKNEVSGLLGLIKKHVGNDVLQIFGDTGSCKSKFCLEAARQAMASGMTVYYLDSERNLTDDEIKSLKGCTYKYTPKLSEIDNLVRNLPKVNVVILDSIGFPALTTFARLSLKQKGDALLTMIAIFGDLKIWAYENNGLVIVSNQPESEFNKEKGHIFRPFGDKSQFACKEIWKLKLKVRSAGETHSQISAFRSRFMGFGTKIATLKITDGGVDCVI